MIFPAIALVCLAFLFNTSSAYSQASQSSTRLTIQGPADQPTSGIAKDALGRACVDIEAGARAETINPDMLDHIVSLKNRCPKLIKAKVCYYGSDHCKDVVLEPYKRVDTLLGTMRGIKFFRYSVITK